MPDAAERMNILGRLERGEITPQEAERLLSGETPAPLTRMGILEQVERGELSADQAAERLAQPPAHSRRGEQATREPAAEEVTFTPAEDTSGIWRFFLGAGLAVTLLSAIWMAYVLQRSGMNLWFYCAGLPLAFGIAIMALAWAARNSTWLQMQVRSSKSSGQRVFFTLPLPVGLIQRFLDRRSKNARVIITEAEKRGHFHVDL
jgi:hypothetical protein